jgi:DNA topoisomerase-1
VEAYCVKCKQKRPLVEAQPTFTASGTPATRGKCAVCGTNLYRMGRTPAHEGMEPPEPKRKSRRRSASDGKGKKSIERLVIVESPAKARTVGRFLGKDYDVRASIGHVRDLLRSKLSVDVDNDFEPRYRVPNEKRDVVKDLKAAASRSKEIFLATDPDREGEAIAWHLIEAIGADDAECQRVVFHEITDSAIQAAFSHPRCINHDLVYAQQARRILDRLVGYKLSPLLWEKVKSRLSAGRVQSVALRLIVDREREIDAFVPEEYWSVEGEFLAPEKPPKFRAELTKVDQNDPELGDWESVEPVLADMRGAAYQVGKVKRGTRARRPSAPFTTSTLQQDASRKFRFSTRRTMQIAQQLYEGVELAGREAIGLITYMRTDSTQVSKQAQGEARKLIEQQFGSAYLPGKPPTYHTKTKRAQEAHEAIRPTSVFRTPAGMKKHLNANQLKLYTLIWNRFVASQMKPAIYDTLSIIVDGKSHSHNYELRVSASSLRFAGFLKLYEESPAAAGGGKRKAGREDLMEQLPDLRDGDALQLLELFPDQHFTQPPARFSEASLVKALEEDGIGRPSTYAPIISTLHQRNYVQREGRRLKPTEIGIIVNDLLVEHFPNIVDAGFTAHMEQDLDRIADGEVGWVDVVREFYDPFAKQLEEAREEMPEVRIEPEKLDRACPECGGQLLVRRGRYGKFIGCSNFPECRHTEPWLERIGVRCPEDGGELVERRTRRGRKFYGCENYPECEFSTWKRPLPTPCPKCGSLLVQEGTDKASCTECGSEFEISEIEELRRDMA